jgi:penicillin-binding protein 1A
MTNIIKNILIVTISLFLLSLVTILIVLWTFSNSIPDYKFLKNYKPPVSSKMYSGEGDLVADFSTEKEDFCTL